ncbi:MAG: hypothetical protein WBP41_16325, partial [Saprospiraceae bacterium]
MSLISQLHQTDDFVIVRAMPEGEIKCINSTYISTLSRLLEFRKWMEQHRYSEQTIRNYLNHLSQVFVFLGEMDIKEV